MRFLPIALILLLFSLNSAAQDKFTISGVVKDSLNNETLIGVNVIIPELKSGTMTNEYGFYSITLPQGQYTIQISYLWFTTISQPITFNKNIKLDFSLAESAEALDEVVITEDVERINIKKPQMSVNSLSIKTIKQTPVVLGEVDVIKSITLLPGVTNGV